MTKILKTQEEFFHDRGDKVERIRLEISNFKTKLTIIDTYKRDAKNSEGGK